MTETIDFFVAGGTLRANDPSYVTRPADHDLLQQLRAGEFCYVLTPRQMGKSSLMVRTAQRLRAAGTLVAVIDLTSIGTGSSELSPEQWYLGLLSRVRTQLRLATDVQAWWGEHAALGVAQRFTIFLHDVLLTECSESIVILIDEIDSTLNLNFRDDFFAAIRAVYNERATDPSYQRLTFALFGVATPTDLIQDRERTPFNIGRRIDLNEFTLADAQPLHDGLAANFSTQADAILQRIFYWTNGHPYLTQKLCQVLQSEDARDEDTTVTNYVDSAVQSIFLSEEGRKDPNLTFVQDRVATSPDHEKRRMLQLYRRVQRNDTVLDDNRSPIQNRLELYGLVGVAGGRLQVRNRIYWHVFDSVWITSMMPADQRQRRAVLTAVGALFLMLIVTLYIYLQPATECAVYQERFRNFENSNVRLSALSDLIDQGCQSVAQDLFYDLDRAEQEALFLKLDNWPNERNRLATVIDSIYRTLDTDPKQDVALMKAWYEALEWAEIENGNALHSSIKFWKEGRGYAVKGNYQAALVRYEDALTAISNDNHAILRYDMALAYIELADYDNALTQLDAILRIADAMPVTLTPTISPTPSASPTSPTIPTATQSRNNALAVNELSIPTKLVTDSLKLPTTTITIELSVTRERIVTVAASETITAVKNQDQYQQRFRNADTIRDTVRTLVKDNPKLLLYYQENIVNYQNLAALEIAPVPVAVIPTFTPTSTSAEPTLTIASATSVRTQLTPLPNVILTESPTRLPSSLAPYVYRLKIDGCRFAPSIRRQTAFRVQGLVGIVTALHGVANCTNIAAVSDDGEIFTDLTLSLVDIERDTALLQSSELSQLPSNGLMVSTLTGEGLLNENLTIIGYPLGLEKQDVTKVFLKDIRSLDDVIPDSEETIDFIKRKSPALNIDVLNLQAQLLPGHAGAPVLDSSNRIVGIGNGGLRSGTVDHSWAIPWQEVNLQSVELDTIQTALNRLKESPVFSVFSDSRASSANEVKFPAPSELLVNGAGSVRSIALQPLKFEQITCSPSMLSKAGVMAYIDLQTTLDLSSIQIFTIIEEQTDQYILGSIPPFGFEAMPRYDEAAYVQVLVCSSGQIVAYLPKEQQVAALVNWTNYDQQRLRTTSLEDAIRLIITELGVISSIDSIAYYDTRYPNATGILLIADSIRERLDVVSPNEGFQITFSSNLVLYEFSWSFSVLDTDTEATIPIRSECKIDGNSFSSFTSQEQNFWFRLIGAFDNRVSASTKEHTFTLTQMNAGSSFCGATIVYRDPAR